MQTKTVRTTLALPADLLDATDRAVREGQARSRNQFVADAIRQQLAAQRRAEIDASFAEMGKDLEYQREAAQIMAEFAGADAETARMLYEQEGPYPYTEEELASFAESKE